MPLTQLKTLLDVQLLGTGIDVDANNIDCNLLELASAKRITTIGHDNTVVAYNIIDGYSVYGNGWCLYGFNYDFSFTGDYTNLPIYYQLDFQGDTVLETEIPLIIEAIKVAEAYFVAKLDVYINK